MDVKVLQDLLYVVLIAVIPAVSKFVIDYLQARKERVNLDTSTEYFRDTESKAINLVQTVVDTVSQTYVDALKSKGTFKAKEQKEAFTIALETTKKMMDDEMLEFINTAYSDTDEWIKIQIESYIKASKVKEKSNDDTSKAIPIIDVSTIQESSEN